MGKGQSTESLQLSLSNGLDLFELIAEEERSASAASPQGTTSGEGPHTAHSECPVPSRDRPLPTLSATGKAVLASTTLASAVMAAAEASVAAAVAAGGATSDEDARSRALQQLSESQFCAAGLLGPATAPDRRRVLVAQNLLAFVTRVGFAGLLVDDTVVLRNATHRIPRSRMSTPPPVLMRPSSDSTSGRSQTSTERSYDEAVPFDATGEEFTHHGQLLHAPPRPGRSATSSDPGASHGTAPDVPRRRRSATSTSTNTGYEFLPKIYRKNAKAHNHWFSTMEKLERSAAVLAECTHRRPPPMLVESVHADHRGAECDDHIAVSSLLMSKSPFVVMEGDLALACVVPHRVVNFDVMAHIGRAFFSTAAVQEHFITPWAMGYSSDRSTATSTPIDAAALSAEKLSALGAPDDGEPSEGPPDNDRLFAPRPGHIVPTGIGQTSGGYSPRGGGSGAFEEPNPTVEKRSANPFPSMPLSAPPSSSKTRSTERAREEEERRERREKAEAEVAVWQTRLDQRLVTAHSGHRITTKGSAAFVLALARTQTRGVSFGIDGAGSGDNKPSGHDRPVAPQSQQDVHMTQTQHEEPGLWSAQDDPRRPVSDLEMLRLLPLFSNLTFVCFAHGLPRPRAHDAVSGIGGGSPKPMKGTAAAQRRDPTQGLPQDDSAASSNGGAGEDVMTFAAFYRDAFGKCPHLTAVRVMNEDTAPMELWDAFLSALLPPIDADPSTSQSQPPRAVTPRLHARSLSGQKSTSRERPGDIAARNSKRAKITTLAFVRCRLVAAAVRLRGITMTEAVVKMPEMRKAIEDRRQSESVFVQTMLRFAPTLTGLDLSGSRVCSSFIEHLCPQDAMAQRPPGAPPSGVSPFKHVATLDCASMRIVPCPLPGASPTREVRFRFDGLPALRAVNVSRTSFDGAALRSLAQLPLLEELTAGRTALDAEALRSFTTAHINIDQGDGDANNCRSSPGQQLLQPPLAECRRSPGVSPSRRGPAVRRDTTTPSPVPPLISTAPSSSDNAGVALPSAPRAVRPASPQPPHTATLPAPDLPPNRPRVPGVSPRGPSSSPPPVPALPTVAPRLSPSASAARPITPRLSPAARPAVPRPPGPDASVGLLGSLEHVPNAADDDEARGSPAASASASAGASFADAAGRSGGVGALSIGAASYSQGPSTHSAEADGSTRDRARRPTAVGGPGVLVAALEIHRDGHPIDVPPQRASPPTPASSVSAPTHRARQNPEQGDDGSVFPALVRLDVNGTAADGAALHAIAHLPKLTSLVCDVLDGTDVGVLHASASLRTVQVHRGVVDRAAVAPLRRVAYFGQIKN